MVEKPLDERAIFKVARQIESAEARTEYLKQVCGGREALFVRIVTLLCVHDDEPEFLESMPLALLRGKSPALALTIDQSSISEELGTYIGPYKLNDEIGEGGMGTVYRAVQKEPIRRKVALKVIKAGMDSKQVVSRFEAERQALAMMDHPNIARVIDGGTTKSGRPYFVMELVKGIPITDYCDRYRLTTDQRLEVFGDVCSAVQHAHQKGIIHRDLKPSNILVTKLGGKAIPKVIDFGIAKATSGHLTEESLITAHAQMVGTPLYMAPEQADISAADVDTRSDVYSLGVLLYELLTGTTPFDRDRMISVSFDEFRRIVREEDPPRPSTRLSTLDAALETVADKHHTDPRGLAQAVSGELDWIVMKSLEKDRTRRYESASELAKDIQRYLDDEPVEACPPSKMYRFGKFARRNKSGLITTALIALTLVVGTGISIWQTTRANTQAALAAESASQAEAASECARDNLVMALDAVNELSTQIVDGYLADLPHSETIKREIQQKAIRFYKLFTVKNEHDPTLRRETAMAYHRLGELQWECDDFRGARVAHQKCATLLRGLLADTPNSPESLWFELATCEADLGLVLWRCDRIPEATKVLSTAVRTLELLVRDYPGNTDNAWKLADTEGRLGLCYMASCQLAEAEYWLRTALTSKVHLTAKFPPTHNHWILLSCSYQDLGVYYRLKGNIEGAKQCLREAIRWRRKVLDRIPQSPQAQFLVAFSCADYADLLHSVGQEDLRPDTAVAYVEGIEAAQPLAANFPNTPAYLLTYIRLLCGYGRLSATSEYTEPAGTLPFNFETCEQHFADLLEQLADHSARPWQSGLAYKAHGRLLQILGSPEDAIRQFRSAMPLLRIAIASQPEDPNRVIEFAACAATLAFALRERQRNEEADEVLREATDALSESPSGLNHLAWRLATHPMAEFQQPCRSVEMAIRSVALAPDVQKYWNAQRYWNTLGVAQYRCGDYDAAVASLTRSVELPAGENGYNYVLLAMAYWQLGDEDTSMGYYQRAQEWTENHLLGDGQLRSFLAEAARLLGMERVSIRTKPSDSEKYEVPILREGDIPGTFYTSHKGH